MSVEAQQVEITSPCPITLDRSGISAQDKAMFCAHCTKDVHLLSQMTEPEARELMETEAGKDICVSYAIRGDGSIRFRADSTLVPVSALSRRRLAASAPAPVPVALEVAAPPRRMSLVASIGAALLLAACTPHGDELVEDVVAAKPVVEEPELLEEVPCDELMVAGGIRAEPIPEPDPEQFVEVEGGLRAEPLPPIEPEPKLTVKPGKDIREHRRGGIRARPVEKREPTDPLVDL